MFFVCIGSRGVGKRFSVMDYFLSQWKKKGTPFVWIRLTTISTQKMLANKATKLVDPELVRKYDLELTTKGMDVYDHGKPMCKVLALSEMAKEKGVALHDSQYDGYYNICCDEFQREPGEAKRFDITYNLVGTLENLCRFRKDKIRIFLICNLLEDANEILADGFNFIPEVYGRYKLKSKRAVIDYIPPSMKYQKKRKGTVADYLQPNASNFTNRLSQDMSLVYSGVLRRPSGIIKFTKNPDDWFTVWNERVICPYKNEKLKFVIAMRPYIDERFVPDARDAVYAQYDARALLFKNLITQKKFEKRLEMLRQAR